MTPPSADPVPSFEGQGESVGIPSSSNSTQPRSSTPPLSLTSSASGADQRGFLARVSTVPLVDIILRAYEQAKASSKIVKYGAETIESSVETISSPIIGRLPIAQLDRFVCRQLDMFVGSGVNTPRTPIQEEREERSMSPTPEGEGFSTTRWQRPQGQTNGSDEVGTSLASTHPSNHLSSPTTIATTPNPALPSSPIPILLDPMDPSSGVLYNPFPEAPYPPPWYRSQTNEPGRPRARPGIAAGLIIPCAEGWAWLKRTYGMDLNRDHSQDLTVCQYLGKAIEERDLPYDVKLAQRRDVPWYDFMLVTKWTRGRFMNVGPPGVEEVLQDDLKDLLKAGELEDNARGVLLREFAIKPTEFKCFFM